MLEAAKVFVVSQASGLVANALTSGPLDAIYHLPFNVVRPLVYNSLNWLTAPKPEALPAPVNAAPAQPINIKFEFGKHLTTNLTATALIEELIKPDSPIYDYVPASIRSVARRMIVTVLNAQFDKTTVTFNGHNIAKDIVNSVLKAYAVHYTAMLASDYWIDCDNNPEVCSWLSLAIAGAASEAIVFGLNKAAEYQLRELAKPTAPSQLPPSTKPEPNR